MLLIIFLTGGTVVAMLASFTMLITGTAVDVIWKQKETDYHQMLQHRIPIGVGFVLLAFLLGFAVVGLIRRRRWGWLLSILIFGANLVVDLVILLTDRSWSDLIPVIIEVVVLTWLLLPRTKRGLIHKTTDRD